jgi:hypothetical protein
MVWLPEVLFAPVQPPLAVQAVAFVLDQSRVTDDPVCTVAADEVSVTVGGVLTLTCTACCAGDPPLPEHANVNVVACVILVICWLPLVAFEPLQPPVATQEVAFVLLHVKVVLPPEVTVVGLAVIVRVGAVLPGLERGITFQFG